MKVAFFISASLIALISCTGNVTDETSSPETGNDVIKDDSSDHEQSYQTMPQPPKQPEDDDPCGYQDIVLEDPTNHINNVVITLQIPCSPYYIDEGRPLPIIKK